MRLGIFLLMIGLSTAVQAAPDLTLDALYNDKSFAVKTHSSGRWLKDASGYTTLEDAKGDQGGKNVVRTNPETGAQDVLISASDLIPEGQDKPLDIIDYSWSEDGRFVLIFTNTKRVWRYETQGDYWVLDQETGRLRQLGEGFPASSLMFAKVSPLGDHIAYVQKTGDKIHDLYVEDILSGARTQLTHDGSETIINGTFDWAYEEEFGLRDGFRWSPDGQSIAYWQIDSEGVRDFTLINNTDSLYPELKTFPYPKVGETNSAARVGVVGIAGGDTKWLALPGDPRQHYVVSLEWAGNSDEIIVQQLNRRQNTNRLFIADVGGEPRLVHMDQDDAWLDPVTDFRWLDDGRSFLWVSEKNGWRQLFKVTRDGRTSTQITGDYDVIRLLRVSNDNGYAYFLASPDDPQRQYLYRVTLSGSGAAERLTPDGAVGYHNYTISYDGRYAFHSVSTRRVPAVYDMVDLDGHKQLTVFEDNAELVSKLAEQRFGELEFISAPGADGTLLEGVMMFPPDFDADKYYPLLVFVYGEPAGMTAADRWDRRAGLWHEMMTQKGYIVATIDNRGQPAPKGRAWRKSIYRTLGLTNVDDQAAAYRALIAERPYIDPARVGIWGHSGGGTSTLHALFRHGDVFKAGVSRAPVPDVRLYDSIYQERYSGILPEDAAYYDKAVAIAYADQLTNPLLLIHGTGDDNVHYQGSERLINALVAANKQFRFFSYPNRTHGISEGENTTRHMMIMQTEFFDEKLRP